MPSSITPQTPVARPLKPRLKANHVDYTAYSYPGTHHSFHNDSTPRYDEAAAKLAWQRTVDFLNKNLR